MENSIEKLPQEVSHQNTKSPKKVSLMVLIIALLLCGLVSLAIGFVVSFLVLRTNPFIIETENPIKTEITTTPEEDGPPTLTPEVDVDDSQDVTPSVTATVNSDEIEWLTYTNQQYNFTIQYPKGWIIDGPSTNQSFKIFKGGYIFNLEIMEAWGPEACIYPDTTRPLSDDMTMVGMYFELDNFFHIDGKNGMSFRRTLDATGTKFSICSAEDFQVGEYMGESVEGHLVSYTVPAGAKDPKMMNLLDQMLISFKVN